MVVWTLHISQYNLHRGDISFRYKHTYVLKEMKLDEKRNRVCWFGQVNVLAANLKFKYWNAEICGAVGWD